MGVSAPIWPSDPPAISAVNLLDGIGVPAALLGPDLRVTMINEAARLHAADRGAPGLRFIPGRTWSELCQEADAGADGAKLAALTSGLDQGGSSLDYAARRRGRFKAYRLSLRTMAGTLGQALAIQTDITRTAVTEQRLVDSERHLADIAELSSDWLWSTDSKLRFVELASPHDPRWRRVQPRLIGQDLDGLLAEAAAEIARRRPFRDVVATIPVEGEVHRIRFSGKPRFDTEGRFLGYVGLAARPAPIEWSDWNVSLGPALTPAVARPT
jgi:PAS domain-containing protein